MLVRIQPDQCSAVVQRTRMAGFQPEDRGFESRRRYCTTIACVVEWQTRGAQNAVASDGRRGSSPLVVMK